MGSKREGKSARLPADQDPRDEEQKEMIADIVLPGPRHVMPALQQDRLRLGLIGWKQFATKKTPELSAKGFRDCLARAFTGEHPDLILCSGARVNLGVDTKLQEKASAGVQHRWGPRIFGTAQCPVLFETPDDDDESRWLLATSKRLVLLRYAQNVYSEKGAQRHGLYTIAEWRAGLGTISLPTASGHLTLVLAICNEARMFEPVGTNRKSVVERATRGTEAPDVLRGNWVLLHPAHRSYLNSQDHGLAIAHPTAQRPEPLLSFVTAGAAFADGTLPALAAVHANNYFGTKNKMATNRRNAFVAYRNGVAIKLKKPAEATVGDHVFAWSLLDIPLQPVKRSPPP